MILSLIVVFSIVGCSGNSSSTDEDITNGGDKIGNL